VCSSDLCANVNGCILDEFSSAVCSKGTKSCIAPHDNFEKTNKIIDAAEKYASNYYGDDRQDIVTDVLNAFYAGVKYGEKNK